MTQSAKTRVREYHPWNKGKMTGQKRPLKARDVWSIRVRLQMEKNWRDLALFNLAIDSKLRGCDLLKLKIDDLWSGGAVKPRATVVQQKTGRPVQFEITEPTREALETWRSSQHLSAGDWLFPSPNRGCGHICLRSYSRFVHRWIELIDLPSAGYGTHSLRRTKATLIYRKTGNVRAVQLLLGHTSLDSTVRYLGVELDDALSLSESVDL